MDLVRAILLATEGEETEVYLEDFDCDAVDYHQALLIDAGLTKGTVLPGSGEIPRRVETKSLTWEGHEFLDSIRSKEVWNKTKETFIKKGLSMTIDLVKGVAIGISTEILKGKI